MQPSPYSLYVNKRPLRTAFFVGENSDTFNDLDRVFEYCREKWGGRYNPVILTDGQSLSPLFWKILEDYDPDTIFTFVPISPDLLGDIARKLAPLHIEQISDYEKQNPNSRLHLRYGGLSYLPTPLNDPMPLMRGAFIKSTLVLLKCHFQQTAPIVSRFSEWNFGEFSNPIQAVSQALEGIPKIEYQLTDLGSLINPLKELTSFKSFLYPIQFCSTPTDALPTMNNDHFGQMFHVVIGDTPKDIAYFWNLQATVPQWKRINLNQVWLPREVATNSELAGVLSGWINRQADPGGSNSGHIRFVSLSLTQGELQQIVEPLSQKLRVPKIVTALPDGPILARETPYRNTEKMDRYPLTGTEESIRLQGPTIYSGPNMDEYWMADLYVEFRPERYQTITGRNLWWQFPRLNMLVSYIFNKPTRVLRERFPSAMIKRDETQFGLKLPSDLNIFRSLCNLPYHPRDPQITDLDVNPKRSPYKRVVPSDKGGYLSGVLELYGGLHPATNILESRYWRAMFDDLSGRNQDKDEQSLVEIENKLKKKLQSNPIEFYKGEGRTEWLPNYLLNFSRSLKAASRDLNFKEFEDRAKKEMEEFKAGRSDGDKWEYSKDDLLRSLRYLTNSGVLLMGLKERCPACGYLVWYHINDVKDTLVCRGCNTTFPIQPEPFWYYQMNSLARAAHAEHGLLPVILVLGKLLIEARSSFMFAPCLDLYENREDTNRVGDLDIAVILDGQFVIGEVKQSVTLFEPDDFDKMEKIAKRLFPDKVIFASMESNQNSTVKSGIERLKTTLQPLGIEVCWYQLDRSIFEPAPVR